MRAGMYTVCVHSVFILYMSSCMFMHCARATWCVIRLLSMIHTVRLAAGTMA